MPSGVSVCVKGGKSALESVLARGLMRRFLTFDMRLDGVFFVAGLLLLYAATSCSSAVPASPAAGIHLGRVLENGTALHGQRVRVIYVPHESEVYSRKVCETVPGGGGRQTCTTAWKGRVVEMYNRIGVAANLVFDEVPIHDPCLVNSTTTNDPFSNVSACTCAVALGKADLCISSHWVTPEDFQMSAFVTPYDTDEFVLYAPVTHGSRASAFFSPFQADGWILLSVIVLVVGSWLGLVEPGLYPDNGGTGKQQLEYICCSRIRYDANGREIVPVGRDSKECRELLELRSEIRELKGFLFGQKKNIPTLQLAEIQQYLLRLQNQASKLEQDIAPGGLVVNKEGILAMLMQVKVGVWAFFGFHERGKGVKSSYGRLIMLMTWLFFLLSSNMYTAMLSVQLSKEPFQGRYTNLDDVISRGGKVCTLKPLGAYLTERNSQIKHGENLIELDVWGENLPEECTTVVDARRAQYAPHLCHLLPVGDTIVTLPLAQPVAKTFRDAFSYWVSKLRYDGSLDSLAYRSLHRNIQRRRACGALGAGITPSGFGYQDLSVFIPILVCVFCIQPCVLFLRTVVLNAVGKRTDEEDVVDIRDENKPADTDFVTENAVAEDSHIVTQQETENVAASTYDENASLVEEEDNAVANEDFIVDDEDAESDDLMEMPPSPKRVCTPTRPRPYSARRYSPGKAFRQASEHEWAIKMELFENMLHDHARKRNSAPPSPAHHTKKASKVELKYKLLPVTGLLSAMEPQSPTQREKVKGDHRSEYVISVREIEEARSRRKFTSPSKDFQVGQIVRVLPRKGPGFNQKGVASVTRVYSDGRVDVQFIHGREQAKKLDPKFVKAAPPADNDEFYPRRANTVF